MVVRSFLKRSGLLIVQYYGMYLPFFLQWCCLVFCFSLSDKHPRHTFISLLKILFSICRIFCVPLLVTLYFVLCVLNLSSLWYRSCMILFYNDCCLYIGLHMFFLVLLPTLCRVSFCRPQSALQRGISAFFCLMKNEE